MAAVLHHSKAKGTALTVLIGIANHEGDGGAWPAIETLAKYGRCSRQRVQQIIAELKKLKELAVDYQCGGHIDMPAHLRPNRYRVLVRCPDDCDGTTRHRPKEPTEAHPNGGPSTVGPPGQEDLAGRGQAQLALTVLEEPPVEPSLVLDMCGPDSGRSAPSVGAPNEIHDPNVDEPEPQPLDAEKPDYVQRRADDRERFWRHIHDIAGGTEVKILDSSTWSPKGAVRIEVLYDSFRKYACVGKKPMKWPGAFFENLYAHGADNAVTDWLTNQGMEPV